MLPTRLKSQEDNERERGLIVYNTFTCHVIHHGVRCWVVMGSIAGCVTAAATTTTTLLLTSVYLSHNDLRVNAPTVMEALER